MIKYIKGDGTNPPDLSIISHIVNDQGGWGRGFVVDLSKRFPGSNGPEYFYRNWVSIGEYIDVNGDTVPFALGNIQLVQPLIKKIHGKDVIVCNMIAQHKTGSNPPTKRYVQYDSLMQCLIKLSDKVVELNSLDPNRQWSVVMPDLIGTGLGGGDRETILELIDEALCQNDNIDVNIYTKE